MISASMNKTAKCATTATTSTTAAVIDVLPSYKLEGKTLAVNKYGFPNMFHFLLTYTYFTLWGTAAIRPFT